MPEGMRQTLTPLQLETRKKTHTMLLCKIIVGKQQLGKKWLTKPADGFDSARNGSDPGAPNDGIQGTYFLIFNADHILPIAIIEYTINRR